MKNWALILGASSGIGAECAIKLAKKGLNIYGIYLRKKSAEVEQIINKIEINSTYILNVFRGKQEKERNKNGQTAKTVY